MAIFLGILFLVLSIIFMVSAWNSYYNDGMFLFFLIVLLLACIISFAVGCSNDIQKVKPTIIKTTPDVEYDNDNNVIIDGYKYKLSFVKINKVLNDKTNTELKISYSNIGAFEKEENSPSYSTESSSGEWWNTIGE
jgi:uncharacterized membrane protein YfhO